MNSSFKERGDTRASVYSFFNHKWHFNSLQLADSMLRVAVVIHVAGLAVSLLSGAGSAIGSIGLMEWGLTHDAIYLTERIASLLLLLLAVSLLIYPTIIALVVIGGAVFAETYATALFGGEHYSEYALLTHALRFLIPLVITILILSRHFFIHQEKITMTAAWILRGGLASVFFMHGLEAIWHHPQFIDLVIGSAQNTLELTVSERSVTKALTVIGILDVIVAFLLLIRPWPALLAWLAFWGLVTALSRPLASGFASYPEVLVRASHFISPIALWALLLYINRHRAYLSRQSPASTF